MNPEAERFASMEKLYHFTTLSNAEKIVENNTLKFGRLKQMNDLCENSKNIYNYLHPLHPNINTDYIKTEINKYRQISLTEDKTVFGRKGFDLHQMWGKYAADGRGVCLVFDKNKLIEAIEKEGECNHRNVIYLENFSPDVFTDIRRKKEIQKWVQDNANQLFFIKRKEWEHEQEYRIVKRFEDYKKNYFFNFCDSLKYIILASTRARVPYNNTKSAEKCEPPILKSKKYEKIQQYLPHDVHILVYEPYLGSYILYNITGNIIWSETGEYGFKEGDNIDI